MRLPLVLVVLAACEIGGPTPPPVTVPSFDGGRLGQIPPLPADALPTLDGGILDGGVIVHLDSLP